MMEKFLVTLCMLSIGLSKLLASTAYSGCPDFTDLTASYVEPYASGKGNVIVDGRHTVISSQGTDPRTGNKLQLLPEGFSKVVKLGNLLGGNEYESLTYHLKPTFDDCILKMKFAVVFENPDHVINEQPYFSISVTDVHGVALPKTFAYHVYANEGLTNFNEYTYGNSRIMWCDWQNAVIDLSRYVGQEILLTIKTRDCLQNGHFSYAYFCGTCDSNFMEIECLGDKVSMTMMDGFESYNWSDGSSSQTYKGDLDDPTWCDLKSYIGEVTRMFMSWANNANPIPDVVNETVCEGSDYYWNGQKIDTNFKGTCRFSNVEVDKDKCSSKLKILVLTTIPAYHIFDETICEGENYEKNGFSIKNPPAGFLQDTIEIESNNNCRQWNVLNLKVMQKTLPPVMVGDEAPCTKSARTYRIQGDYSCVWTLPSNVEYEDDHHLTNNNVTIRFTNANESVLSVVCDNGCAAHTVSKTIHPVQSLSSYIVDSICQGLEYKKGEWNLGIQNKVGYTTHVRQLGDSCNSTEVLVLYTMESPMVKIAGDSIVCVGDPVNLSTSDYNSAMEEEYYALGDIWCEDGTILHLDDFLRSGKVGKGMVFWATPTDSWSIEPGWELEILDLHDEFNGDVVPYDAATMDNDTRLVNYMPYRLFPKWTLLNEFLAKVEGADLWEGNYWSRFKDYSGRGDTHRLYYGSPQHYSLYDQYRHKNMEGIGYTYDSMDKKHKVRYIYELKILNKK